GAVEPRLREYYRDRGFDDTRMRETPEVEALNARFGRSGEDDLHARLKRVYEVRLTGRGRRPVVARVIAESVGWGWLGYHAYVAGMRLHDFVPRLIGLRNGLLFSEWVGETVRGAEGAADGALRRTMSAYVAARVQRLGVGEAPACDSPDDRGAGWGELVGLLRGVY